ncbi:MAG: PHP-associated domain-containing protein [Thermodesulfobacteriota bacterium]|nr:PHP-associated domain-containing protein [Thermodesulfobacteriota bacterium]
MQQQTVVSPASLGHNDRVLYRQPDFPDLCRNHTVVDLHFHSVFSDGADLPAMIAKKARIMDIGVAVTDHNAIEGAMEMERYPDVLSIPGIEVTSKEGAHVLVYFYETRGLKHFYRKTIYPAKGRDIMSSIGLSMESIISRARQNDGIVIFPHPYCAMYTGLCNILFSEARQQELLARADGVEVINAGNLKKWNLKSTILGFNLNKAMTGGSDGHSLAHLGRSVTYTNTPRDRIAFLDALKQNTGRVIGQEVPFLRKVVDNSAKLPSHIKNSGNLMDKNMRYSFAILNRKSRQFKADMQRRLGGNIFSEIRRK